MGAKLRHVFFACKGVIFLVCQRECSYVIAAKCVRAESSSIYTRVSFLFWFFLSSPLFFVVFLSDGCAPPRKETQHRLRFFFTVPSIICKHHHRHYHYHFVCWLSCSPQSETQHSLHGLTANFLAALKSESKGWKGNVAENLLSAPESESQTQEAERKWPSSC